MCFIYICLYIHIYIYDVSIDMFSAPGPERRLRKKKKIHLRRMSEQIPGLVYRVPSGKLLRRKIIILNGVTMEIHQFQWGNYGK